MDPLTAALNLATKIVELIILEVQGMTPEQRSARIQQRIDNLAATREFWQKLIPKT